MKKFLLALLLLPLISCSKDNSFEQEPDDDDAEETVTLEIVMDESPLEFPASTGGSAVRAMTSNGYWKVEGAADWCRAVPASGIAGTYDLKIEVRAAEFLGNDRVATLTVGDKEIVVTQKKTPKIVTPVKRMLWASINGDGGAVAEGLKQYNNKILVSWRMFPEDDETTSFDLYRRSGSGEESKINTSPITGSTNFQDLIADRSVDNTYRLCYAGSGETLDTYTISSMQASAGLPYISIPIQSTADLDPALNYQPNDAGVGDLDGDGEYEIVLKRLVQSPEEGAKTGHKGSVLLEAYRLDGTFIWRVDLGPNIIQNTTAVFIIDDFNGDGKDEIAVRTSEGTIFGDGTAIGDVDGDGVTDYRLSGTTYIYDGPEFFSVIEGSTGKELARGDYIARGKSEDWGDDYFHRGSCYHMTSALTGGINPSIITTRGIYGKMVLEAWDYAGGKLIKKWTFDTEANNGRYSSYRGHGNHNRSVGDVDGDGFDEITYGACAIDHDGKGLYTMKLAHGDAMHLGDFDPSRPGLEVWSCFEGSPLGAALRDAKTGRVIWKFDNPGDIGRALVADIDPSSPGCEMWWVGGNAHSATGRDLGYNMTSYNMAIWFSGSLNRQLLDRSWISSPVLEGRVFTIYRYNVTTVNSTKENPCFYADILGDWREEVIMVTGDQSELRLFTTWYPTEYKFPYLMSDHIYRMSAINQNVGYNQPTQLGYYLGSDITK